MAVVEDTPLDFKSLNDPSSALYIQALERTNLFVDKFLPKSRIAEFEMDVAYDMDITNEDDLVRHLSSGCLNNLVKKFFKSDIDKCELCETPKTKNNVLARSHCNFKNCTRPSLCRRAIKNCKVKSKVIFIKDIAHEFISLHAESPLYMLCKTCHNEYDKNYKLNPN